jgi:photosystem II stability/assembly factor-like uncharacterized protein
MRSFLKIGIGVLWSAPILVYGQWEKIEVHTEANFRSIHVCDERNVWIGGDQGSLLKSENSGRSWAHLSLPESDSLDFRSVFGFPGGRRALAMSIGEAERGKARIYRTEDGGATWELAFNTYQKGVFLNGLGFWDERNGLCMGDPVDGRFYLLRTRDGGKTWQEVAPSHRPEAVEGEIAFAASGTSLSMGKKGVAYIGTGGGNNARVLRTEDFGVSWKGVESPIKGGKSSGIFGLHFRDRFGIALGGDYKDYRADFINLTFSWDGGETWDEGKRIDPQGLKESAVALDDGFLLVVGHSGSSYSADQGKSWTVLDQLPYHAVSAFRSTVLAVGVKGLVRKFNKP